MRASGILLPVFSIYSPGGIGCFSKEAYEVVDFLKRAGQKYWQILPLGPTSYGDSPYQSFSTFAGNPYFIDLKAFVKEKLLTRAEVKACDCGENERDIDYGKLYENRMALLKKAHERSNIAEDPDFLTFCSQNGHWLNDYALFMAVKDVFGGVCWDEWADDIRYRHDYALDYYNNTYAKEIQFYKFLQYEFVKQWKALKVYANESGIKIIGDIPIYVAYDSADVWAHPELFQLDEKRRPSCVAGVPPDAFSADGQLWGNPLYNWDVHRYTDYNWWIDRITHCFELYDTVRIDHFRGFDEYFSIPYGDTDAKGGEWVKGPGIELFDAIKRRLGEKDIIAEDLGVLTDSVYKLVADSGYPGMKVLSFGFDSGSSNEYLPHNHVPNSVVYTGTHDNETLMGWLKKNCKKSVKNFIRQYINRPGADDEMIAKELIRMAQASVSRLCIIPIQDYLLFGNEARINFPSTLGTNWRWRLKKEDLTKELAKEIKTLTNLYNR